MEAFPAIPHALHSGFNIRIRHDSIDRLQDIEIAVELTEGELTPIWRLGLASPMASPQAVLSHLIQEGLARRRQRYHFARELRRFNDAVARTPLNERYWVCGGLLLGWAREGRILAHDAKDADFMVRSEDADAFHEAVPALERAGYKRAFEYRNNEGVITAYTLLSNHARFDFGFTFPGRGGAERRFFDYGEAPSGLIELECVLPDQPLERFRFLHRDWLKPIDHERVLATAYGDWRIPKVNWDYSYYIQEDRSIVAVRPWTRTHTPWT
jgi:hypothetical protein